MTLGDVLDRALGGPERFVCDHCRNDRHFVCLGDVAGRTCECETGGVEAHPLRPHRYVAPAVAAWRTCRICGAGANAGRHRR